MHIVNRYRNVVTNGKSLNVKQFKAQKLPKTMYQIIATYLCRKTTQDLPSRKKQINKILKRIVILLRDKDYLQRANKLNLSQTTMGRYLKNIALQKSKCTLYS